MISISEEEILGSISGEMSRTGRRRECDSLTESGYVAIVEMVIVGRFIY